MLVIALIAPDITQELPAMSFTLMKRLLIVILALGLGACASAPEPKPVVKQVEPVSVWNDSNIAELHSEWRGVPYRLGGRDQERHRLLGLCVGRLPKNVGYDSAAYSGGAASTW